MNLQLTEIVVLKPLTANYNMCIEGVDNVPSL